MAYGMLLKDHQQVLVFINADPQQPASFKLSAGTWRILANAAAADPNGLGQVSDAVEIAPRSGIILVQ